MTNTDDDEFYSPSFIIARDQALMVRQAYCVRAAVQLFTEEIASANPHPPQSIGWHEVRARADVLAKAFVYEAATLRALAIDVANRFPQFAEDARCAVAEFDRKLGQLVPLRNSQAHIDERLNFRARGKPITMKSMSRPRLDTLCPPQACGNTVQGTTEAGVHAVIVIDDRATEAADQLVEGVFASLTRIASASPRSG